MSNASKSVPKSFQYYFRLEDHYIFCKKDKDSNEEIAYMDIKYSFLKINKQQQTINGKKLFSIKFIKKKTYEELFNEDLNIIEKWYKKLLQYCILTKFRYYYISKKVLG